MEEKLKCQGRAILVCGDQSDATLKLLVGLARYSAKPGTLLWLLKHKHGCEWKLQWLNSLLTWEFAYFSFPEFHCLPLGVSLTQSPVQPGGLEFAGRPAMRITCTGILYTIQQAVLDLEALRMPGASLF